MMNTSNKIAVIISGVSSGQYLAGLFHQYGYRSIHIKSDPQAEDIPNAEDYLAHFTYTGDMDALLAQLATYDIFCVIAGADEGIYLADALAAALNLPGNSPQTTAYRRNKYIMAECLSKNNLASIPHFQSETVEEVVKWAKQQAQWPLIIKPVDGAGTEGFYICADPLELHDAAAKLLNMQSLLGHRHSNILCQPFMQGTEYMVNTISVDGEHHVTDIWCCNKIMKNQSMIYDYSISISIESDVYAILTPYIYAVLDALDVVEGLAHSEVMLTAQGPVLIEVNQRVMGLGINPEILSRYLGVSQSELLVMRYVNFERYQEKVHKLFVTQNTLACVHHIVEKENCYAHPSGFKKIQQLPSFIGNKFDADFFTPLAKTRDLATSYGWVLLGHNDFNVIKSDIKKLRVIEKDDLFT